MNTEEIAEQIRYLIESEPARQWKVREMGDILGYRGHRAKILVSVLNGLVEEGSVRMIHHGVYALADGDLVTGRIEIARSGVGFVTDPGSGKTYRVESFNTAGAMPGDTVAVRILRNGADASTARVVKIKSRNDRAIVGTLVLSDYHSYVVPIDPVYRHDIEVPGTHGAKDNDRVVVRILEHGDSRTAAKGEIVDVIGPADKPSLDTEAICREYELPGDFPPEVIEEATTAHTLMRRSGKRLDLRKKYILTVDPETARDFDDALSFEVAADGTRTLGVHIADVGFFVRKGSAIDVEAEERSTSIYLADKVIPMLPEQLCNGVCSLRPDEDRLCMSVFMDFDAKGRVVARRFARTKIRSKLRLNYEQALAIIEDRKPDGLEDVPEDAVKLLKGCTELALQLRSARMNAGALDLDVPECEILFDDEQRMTGFKLREYDVSHQMIEECMVAANEAVAAELSSRGIRVMSRLHEAPDPSKLDDLSANLRALGFTPGNISTPKNLARFIASIAEHPLKEHAHTMILRSMKRAVYSADETGHFGLAKHFYSHFTSPIRRYPDLILHRQLADFLAQDSGNSASVGYLKRMAMHCTEREQRADDAERALLEIKKYRYLEQQIADRKLEEYDAVISKVTNFGLFVDVNDLQVGGLVHIGTISNNFVRYDRYNEALSVDGHTYTLGGNVRVTIARVDFMQRKLDFSLVREDLVEKAAGRRIAEKSSRAKVERSEKRSSSSRQFSVKYDGRIDRKAGKDNDNGGRSKSKHRKSAHGKPKTRKWEKHTGRRSRH